MITHYDESVSKDTLMKVKPPLNTEDPLQYVMRNGVVPKEIPASEYSAPNFDDGVYDVSNVGRRVKNDFDAMRNLRELDRRRRKSKDDSDKSNP